MIKDCDFPEFILTKWQKLIDLLSSTFSLPATLIMQVDEDSMKIFAKCSTEENPYLLGDTEKIDGLYCEAVIKSKEKLLVTNALSDKDWDKNPDLKFGMVAYLGYPIKYASGEIFGTICVLDNKENPFGKTIDNFLLQVRDIIELDIYTYHSYEKASKEMEQNMLRQFSQLGLDDKTQSEIENYKPNYDSLCQGLN
ncbi:GAF domain-containing protein [Ancylomarina sp. 16SWW S1-10-2]|uniref:GAF domain-containing protein n=1 Tax=Ancylomarina sp. 16SWW S1-10-2 TaxID=2499681 RepID=UPI0012ADB725|nr:GAF domain-containing protein [Ancylomarina sp. 16SWW S1-10-2]MRT91847.1 GAF domain-containing protein [Ancylomarina sp. 16SWW S1-10-2]